LETLRHCLPPSVSRILAELPETLDETYERILREIPKTNRVHAHRLLQCLTVAVRPLAVEELAEVLAINFDAEGGIPKLNENFRWADQEQAVLSACSSLVAIVKYEGSESESDSRRVQFSHFSVKEFLTSDRLDASVVDILRGHHISLEPAHTIMAQACLSVLLRLDDHMDKETILSYPLAEYAGKCFVDHVKFGDVLSHINDGLDDLLDPDKPHFNLWLWLESGGDWVSRSFVWHSSPESYPGETLSDQSNPERPAPICPPRIFPLYYVLARQHTYLAKRLILKRPRDVDASDKYGITALHIAACTANCKVAQMLIERTAAINSRDDEGRTPLHYAMRDDMPGWAESEQKLHDIFHCVRLLLDHGASAEAQNNHGSTPLHLAAAKARQEIVQSLIENSTNIDLRNNDGETALHYASRRGQINNIRLILSHNADVDALDNGGSTPLHLAIPERYLAIPEANLEAVQLLLEQGAKINLQNHMGKTALHLASQRGYLSIIQLMLNHDANVDALDNEGSTPLHLAISGASLEAIQLLLNHGASITLRNGKGQTALHRASQRGHLDIIQLILNHGADVDTPDNDGSTPLHLAIFEGTMADFEGSSVSSGGIAISEARPEASLKAVQLLLKHGVDINLQNHMGQTALHKASQCGHLGTIELILNQNVDVDALDHGGSTPLHLAISNGHLGIAQLLLKHGASVHTQNNRGETLFQAASARGLQEITELLSIHIQREQMA
jgi:ankyrin repeat protein